MKKLKIDTLKCIACDDKTATWLKQVMHEGNIFNLYLCKDCVYKTAKELLETQKNKGTKNAI